MNPWLIFGLAATSPLWVFAGLAVLVTVCFIVGMACITVADWWEKLWFRFVHSRFALWSSRPMMKKIRNTLGGK